MAKRFDGVKRDEWRKRLGKVESQVDRFHSMHDDAVDAWSECDDRITKVEERIKKLDELPGQLLGHMTSSGMKVKAANARIGHVINDLTKHISETQERFARVEHNLKEAGTHSSVARSELLGRVGELDAQRAAHDALVVRVADSEQQMGVLQDQCSEFDQRMLTRFEKLEALVSTLNDKVQEMEDLVKLKDNIEKLMDMYQQLLKDHAVTGSRVFETERRLNLLEDASNGAQAGQ